MLTCDTCTCYVTSLVGGVGCVNVHVNLRHMHMLCHVLGWGVGCVNVHVNLRHTHMLRHVLGWGVGCVNVLVNLRHMHMLRHVLGWGVGCVNVHVNLRHMHMLRHVLGWVGWGVLTFLLTCVTWTCYVTSAFPLAGIIVVGCAQMLIQM